MAERILLGVNIDHAATLRQARYRETGRVSGKLVEPDVLEIALLAERYGADGITVHPREDARHVQRDDVVRLRQGIHTRLNMEMACTDDMLAFALAVQPDSVCLVPENRDEVTTEGGLDVVGQRDRVSSVTAAMRSQGAEVSLFIDPDDEAIDLAAELGATHVELHTGSFANTWHNPVQREAELEQLRLGAARAHERGLIVNAGHGINYHNVYDVRRIPWLHELNIGHAIISRALFAGMGEAVAAMRRALD